MIRLQKSSWNTELDVVDTQETVSVHTSRLGTNPSTCRNATAICSSANRLDMMHRLPN
jgi:hypothetical protein